MGPACQQLSPPVCSVFKRPSSSFRFQKRKAFLLNASHPPYTAGNKPPHNSKR